MNPSDASVLAALRPYARVSDTEWQQVVDAVTVAGGITKTRGAARTVLIDAKTRAVRDTKGRFARQHGGDLAWGGVGKDSDDVDKANPHHDASGRFAAKPGGGAGAASGGGSSSGGGAAGSPSDVGNPSAAQRVADKHQRIADKTRERDGSTNAVAHAEGAVTGASSVASAKDRGEAQSDVSRWQREYDRNPNFRSDGRFQGSIEAFEARFGSLPE